MGAGTESRKHAEERTVRSAHIEWDAPTAHEGAVLTRGRVRRKAGNARAGRKEVALIYPQTFVLFPQGGYGRPER